MYLFFRLFNNAITLAISLFITLYTYWRFFIALRCQSGLTKETAEFHSVVHQARSALDFISENVTEIMKEIKEDVDAELSVTEELTKLNAKMAETLQRFSSLEENVIEFVRMDRKMDNARVETPDDVAKEVRRVLNKKKLQMASVDDDDRSQRRIKLPEVKLLREKRLSDTTWIVDQ